MNITQKKQLIDLVNFSFKFAGTNRVTMFPDGKRFESDTDHTVTLSLTAVSVASILYPELDQNLILRFALVHDLLEAHTGDYDAKFMSDEMRQEKQEAEDDALEKIQSDFSEFGWIADTIQQYENLSTKEARFVRLMDKCQPELSNILNKNTPLKKQNIDVASIYEHFTQKRKSYRTLFNEFPEMESVFDWAQEEMMKN